jgi:integrase
MDPQRPRRRPTTQQQLIGYRETGAPSTLDQADPHRVQPRRVRSWRPAATLSHALPAAMVRWFMNRMSGDGINRAVRAAAVRAGLPDATTFTAHSPRAGGATAVARAGHPVAAIARQGRWSPTSPVVHSYVRAVDKCKDNPLVGVL